VVRNSKSKIDVLFQIKTNQVNMKANRSPVDLCVVLDRSGSMAGAKLENSKDAIKQIIQTLMPDDRIHLVTYEDGVEVVFEDGDYSMKEKLIEMVGKITIAGSTNLYGGLERGGQVLQVKKDSPLARSSRIFIFSDGLANVGKANPEDIIELARNIHSHGVTICSFGIGADFSEQVMRGIAEHGSGDYFFIEGPASIPKLVEKALKGFRSLIGTEALLQIRGKNGAVLLKAHGYTVDEIQTGIKLFDLRENDVMKVALEVEVSPQPYLEEMDVLEYELSYIPVGQPDRQVAVSGLLSVKLTDDEQLVNDHLDKDVRAFVKVQQINDENQKVLEHMQNNRMQEAIDLKKDLIRKLNEFEDDEQIPELNIARSRELAVLVRMEDKEASPELKHHTVSWSGSNTKRVGSSYYDEL